MNTTYTPVIGMETHIELKTASKMFCGCVNDPFGAEAPNTHTCPTCLGFPGALVVPNRKAVDWTIRLALALNCEVSLESKFDRKHYSYADLAKGYQISQYDQPIGHDGWMEVGEGADARRVRINRIHLEEDTGKLVHEKVGGKDLSLVDFNRSGVPLVEIVTEPDFRSAAEAKEYGKKLQRIARYVGVSDADMEKGSMRLEANVSLTKGAVDYDDLPPYKVELKNINSFRFMAAAVEYEIARQAPLLDAGERLPQETRGWNEAKKETFSQRSKEDAQDYRYFPEPDIPPMRFTAEAVAAARAALPTLPDAHDAAFAALGLPADTRDLLIESADTAARVRAALDLVADQKKFVNWFVRNRAALADTAPDALAKRFTAEHTKAAVSDADLAAFVAAVIDENPDPVAEYRAGKEKALGYLAGQVQKKARGGADAAATTALLKAQLA
jgi:aspartyl-tRNA(Asn)/glutamyl-tRNA(Gln) amidotransferase subunit B